MQSNEINKSRRRFLTTAATIIGGIGAAAATVPFISAMAPSARAKAIGAPVEVDISRLKPGELMIEEWQGKPVWILRRDQAMLDELHGVDKYVSDPDSKKSEQPEYAANMARSINPEYLVVVGLCTHLGCSPTYMARGELHNLGSTWKGGFFCPCHGSRFDLAGRVFKDVPAPYNLVVPPHQYLGPKRLLIGDDSGVA